MLDSSGSNHVLSDLHRLHVDSSVCSHKPKRPKSAWRSLESTTSFENHSSQLGGLVSGETTGRDHRCQAGHAGHGCSFETNPIQFIPNPPKTNKNHQAKPERTRHHGGLVTDEGVVRPKPFQGGSRWHRDDPSSFRVLVRRTVGRAERRKRWSARSSEIHANRRDLPTRFRLFHSAFT